MFGPKNVENKIVSSKILKTYLYFLQNKLKKAKKPIPRNSPVDREKSARSGNGD